MEDLLEFLKNYWWTLIIVVPWVLSAIGDVFTKAARKAAQEERARRREASPDSQPVAGGERTKAASAADVAADIRRMMGMEVMEERRSPAAQKPVVVLEEDWDDPEEWRQTEWQETQSQAPQLPEPQDAAAEFGSLHERMAHKEPREISQVGGRHIHPATEFGGVHDRHLQTGLMAKLQVREGGRSRVRSTLHAARRRGLVDLTDPARAFFRAGGCL